MEGWPERFSILPRLERAGAFLGRLVHFFPPDAPDYMSEHYNPPEASHDAHTATVLPFVLNARVHDVQDIGWPDDGDIGA